MSPAFLIAAFVLILDRVTKSGLSHRMHEGQSFAVLPKVFHITLVHNKGIAFGLFKGMTHLFFAMSLVIIASLVAFMVSARRGAATAVAGGLIIGGAIGNAIDRFRFGYVIDFLDFRVWPVFNVADSAITVGAMLLAWDVVINSKRKSKNSK